MIISHFPQGGGGAADSPDTVTMKFLGNDFEYNPEIYVTCVIDNNIVPVYIDTTLNDLTCPVIKGSVVFIGEMGVNCTLTANLYGAWGHPNQTLLVTHDFEISIAD